MIYIIYTIVCLAIFVPFIVFSKRKNDRQNCLTFIFKHIEPTNLNFYDARSTINLIESLSIDQLEELCNLIEDIIIDFKPEQICVDTFVDEYDSNSEIGFYPLTSRTVPEIITIMKTRYDKLEHSVFSKDNIDIVVSPKWNQ